MKSRPIATSMTAFASQLDSVRDDARAAGFLLAHNMLGTLALGTAPTNGQVIPIVVNGTTITLKAVASVANANDIYNPGTALGFATNVLNFLRRPDVTNSNQVAASLANQLLLSYVGWAWPGSSTNIVAFSLNKNINDITGPLTSFNITGITVTSATWTANTLALYVEDGTFYINGVRYLFTGGVTPTVTPPVSNSRIDVLSINSSGTLSWTTGTPGSSPVAPTYPNNQVAICELTTPSGATALYDLEDQQSGQGWISNDVRSLASYIPNLGAIAVDLVPAATDTQNLGESGSSEWLGIYGKTIYQSGVQVASTRFGGTGASGALSITSGTTTINLGSAAVYVANYTSISITGTASLAFSSPAAGGTIVVLKSQGNVTITSSATAAINLAGVGGAGGATGGTSGGSQGTANSESGGGAGMAGAGTSGGSHLTSGGGQGSPGGAFGVWLDGISIGGAISASNSVNSSGGTVAGINSNIQAYHKYYVLPGGGGSAGQGGSNGVGGTGGAGGGALYIECAGSLNFTGTINANGGAPSTGTAGVYGGGGGGGSVQILYNILTANSGTITVAGNTTNTSAEGGNGIYYVGANTEFA